MAFVDRPQTLTGRLSMAKPEEQRLPPAGGPVVTVFQPPAILNADYSEIEKRVVAWYMDRGL